MAPFFKYYAYFKAYSNLKLIFECIYIIPFNLYKKQLSLVKQQKISERVKRGSSGNYLLSLIKE